MVVDQDDPDRLPADIPTLVAPTLMDGARAGRVARTGARLRRHADRRMRATAVCR